MTEDKERKLQQPRGQGSKRNLDKMTKLECMVGCKIQNAQDRR